jgi:hypothetical protein
MLAVYAGSPVMWVACGLGALWYALLTRGLIARADDLQVLLRFRTHYRIIFALLIVLLCGRWLLGLLGVAG